MTTLNLYNAIIKWAGHYGTGKIFGGTLTNGKQIYASNQMRAHYGWLAQQIHVF